jgi:hypothetical protein
MSAPVGAVRQGLAAPPIWPGVELARVVQLRAGQPAAVRAPSRRPRRAAWRTAPRPFGASAANVRCSECVRGRLPLPEALGDELGPLVPAPAVQHL